MCSCFFCVFYCIRGSCICLCLEWACMICVRLCRASGNDVLGRSSRQCCPGLAADSSRRNDICIHVFSLRRILRFMIDVFFMAAPQL